MRQRRRAEVSLPSTTEPETKNPDRSDSEKTRRVFLFCLAFRLANALLVQTYFNPDEHWQSLEVAHRIAFGYGHLTWEWKKGIRSYLHPLLFALLYKVMAFLGLDTPLFMIKAPRLLQSIFSAVGDLYLYKLSVLLFGHQVAKWALTNWFMFFCIARTLSNSMETVLTLVSLYYWPCLRPSSSKIPLVSRKFGLAIAAIACALRPTSAIIWLYIGLLELFVTRDRLRFIFLEVAPIGFVLPVLPIALMFSGYSLAAISTPNSPIGKKRGSSSVSGKWPPKMRLAVLFLLASNIPMALYMSLIHQRGTEDVMNHLSKEVPNEKVKSVLFLMPCHATPYYSTLHRDIPMHFLDCSPSENKGVPDESDRFMMDPAGFASEYAKNWSIPSHIVLFESEEKLLKDFLVSHSYKEEKRFFHAHFKVDRDLQASVAVYVLTGQ
ncbi:hypothetical protein TIFTF001_049160 [Ficus carica]|uniref:Mannosyltransferase n=1 Tax=Ficus carica TaxID=3494 RepID=A0AA87ZHA4_FICCA|nr:hypothetical protein TIFTF001_049157 [Ficus carica]GMN24623.1 hypothetical protein TIFTF001_049158 [Ficus carica]GMN24636.1 hypothetical protein TIFTF001_049159 [Ficus carica]GMN24646.1 hypothetical protein TIFTF001_049160 [Ficus carica]